MKGSIRQRGSSSFELRVYVGTDPDTGKRRWITRTVRGTRADAQRELKVLAAHANVAPAVGAHTTVGELLDQWFARGRTGWSPTTVRNLGSIVERHLKPALGDVLVGDLTAAIVDQFYERLRTEGRIDGKPLAIGTVRRVHSTLHAALAQAQRWSWVFDNVADHASPPRDEPVEMRPPTPAEVARLLESVADDPPLQLYLTLAATTGARRGRRSWPCSGSGSRRFISRSEASRCSVRSSRDRKGRSSFPPRPVVRIGWRSPPPASNSCGPTVSEENGEDAIDQRFVFCADRTGTRPWLPNFVTKRFIVARRAAGLGHFRLHDLRHFMATEMLDAGVPVPIVAARLAHARASTTLNVYAHAVPGGDHLAAEALWRRVEEARWESSDSSPDSSPPPR